MIAARKLGRTLFPQFRRSLSTESASRWNGSTAQENSSLDTPREKISGPFLPRSPAIPSVLHASGPGSTKKKDGHSGVRNTDGDDKKARKGNNNDGNNNDGNNNDGNNNDTIDSSDGNGNGIDGDGGVSDGVGERKKYYYGDDFGRPNPFPPGEYPFTPNALPPVFPGTGPAPMDFAHTAVASRYPDDLRCVIESFDENAALEALKRVHSLTGHLGRNDVISADKTLKSVVGEATRASVTDTAMYLARCGLYYEYDTVSIPELRPISTQLEASYEDRHTPVMMGLPFMLQASAILFASGLREAFGGGRGEVSDLGVGGLWYMYGTVAAECRPVFNVRIRRLSDDAIVHERRGVQRFSRVLFRSRVSTFRIMSLSDIIDGAAHREEASPDWLVDFLADPTSVHEIVIERGTTRS